MGSDPLTNLYMPIQPEVMVMVCVAHVVCIFCPCGMHVGVKRQYLLCYEFADTVIFTSEDRYFNYHISHSSKCNVRQNGSFFLTLSSPQRDTQCSPPHCWGWLSSSLLFNRELTTPKRHSGYQVRCNRGRFGWSLPI